MPTPSELTIGDNPSVKDLTDYVIKLQRDYTWLLQNLDDMNVRRLTADVIVAGTIDANVVTIRSDLSGGAYVQIDGNGMVVNNGISDTFTVDINGDVTMTGATIQSSAGSYPRISIDPSDTLFAAYASSTDYLSMEALSSISSTPALLFWESLMAKAYLFLDSSTGLNINGGTGIVLDSGFDIDLIPDTGSGRHVRLPSWSALYSLAQGQSIQDALNAKADASTVATAGFFTSSAGGHNHGIAPGTQLALNGGGFVTWLGASDHSHTQT